MTTAGDSIATDTTFNFPHLCRYFSELSPQPMLAVEGKTCIVRHVNDAFLQLSGANRSDLMGRPFALAVPEKTANGCLSLLDRVYRTGKPEFLADQQHGQTPSIYWSYAVWPILGSNDCPVGVMIQVTDSTETANFRAQAATMNEALLVTAVRQQELAEASEALNARLQAAVKEKEDFIAILSHELRTPLAPVLIAASILERDRGLGPEARGLMQMIHRNVTLEARLIDDLLDMTRLGRGKLRLEHASVDLRGILERAVEACRADMENGNLTLEVDIGGAPQIVDADAGRLLQVFSNLLRNAAKFTPPGGHVRVRSRCDGTLCMAEVSDTGEGIDPDFLPRAFAPFEQDDRLQPRKAGLGLGLAICKTIVELHGGTITAESEGKGRGASFMVTLPAFLGARAAPEEIVPVAPAPPRPIKPLRILLVEDDVDTARVMRWLLRADGHDVQWAGDVSTALKLSAAHQFDLLLSDLGLPDGSGLDLMRTLRQEGSTLPGIVLSGYGQEEDLAQSREAGFTSHLIKPLSPQMIRDAIFAQGG